MLCRIRHAWTAWSEELRECPDGDAWMGTISVLWRACRRCEYVEEYEEVMSCV